VGGEESRGRVGLDFWVGFQYNTGCFEGGKATEGASGVRQSQIVACGDAPVRFQETSSKLSRGAHGAENVSGVC
jgi:hypothetical protein